MSIKLIKRAWIVAALTLGGCALDIGAGPRDVTISATPLALDSSAPDRASVGELHFLGGVELTSKNPAFGGLSSLRWQDGWLHTLSDQNGAWFAMQPSEDGERLIGIEKLRGVALVEGNTPLYGERESDAEAIDFIVAPCAGIGCPPYAVRIALERIDRILIYKLLDGMPTGRPRRMGGIDGWLGRQTENLGIESMAGDADETLMISEGLLSPDGKASALLFRPGAGATDKQTPRPIEIGIPAEGPQRPSEIASLGGGRYVMLRRSWSEAEGFRTLMELLTLEGSGTEITARTRRLANFAPPLANDNFEGLAVRKEGERLFLYMISDNNFSPSQRTLLLKFELVDRNP